MAVFSFSGGHECLHSNAKAGKENKRVALMLSDSGDNAKPRPL
jgi:hypothetical protein